MTTFWKPTGSLDVSTDPSSLPSTYDGNNEISGAMQRCKNLRLDENGVVKTRYGSSVLDSGMQTNMHEIIEQAGYRYTFSSDRIYRDGLRIALELTDNKWSGILYNSFNASTQNIFALNGTDRKRIDGLNVNEWGITAPTNAPTIAIGLLTGLTGDYNAKYTYLRKEGSVVVCESDPSPAAAAAVTLANESLDITWIASSDTQVTHVRVYRTLADGLIYYYDQEIATGTLTVDSNTGDASMGSEVETDHDRPPLGSFVIGPNYNGTCFIIKDNLLYYCSPKQPEYWPTLNFIEVSQKQFPGKCAVFWNGQLYYFTKIGLHLIQGTGSTSFFPLKMSAATGAQSDRGAVSVNGKGIYHVGVDGIYLYSNQNDSKITQVVFEKIFNGITVNDVPGVDRTKLDLSWIDHFQGKIYFGYCGKTDTYPTNIIIFDYTTQKMSYYSYPFPIRSIAEDKTNSLLLAGDNSGNVYNIEKIAENSDGPIEISWEIETKDFTLQTRKHFPRFTKYDVDASEVSGETKGTVYLDGEKLQEHTLSEARNTRRRLITTGNGDKVSIKIEGAGPVSIYAMEFE